MSLKIVTDSTCDIPAELVAQYGITVIPAYVNIGEESFRDGVDLSRDTFYANLNSYATHPTSAAPAPGTFATAYNRLLAEGASGIISIHIASSLSGILNSGRMGAEMLEQPRAVTLFDSQQLSMGLGFQVLAAARAAEAGRSVAEIVTLLSSLVDRTYTYCLLDTLDAIRRGGRISWLQMSVGNLLRIKPVVRAYQGEVTPAAQVRTRKRAFPKLRDMVAELGPLAEISFLDTNVPHDVAAFADLIADLIPEGVTPIPTIACPAIGVHVGARAIGVACVVR